jgi:hypothetical protein
LKRTSDDKTSDSILVKRMSEMSVEKPREQCEIWRLIYLYQFHG